MRMARPSHREQILASGMVTLHQRGFAATGVREIASAADVPLGSFTNHFRSKEEFGLAVLNRYFEELDATVQATLGDQTQAPLDRLRAYFDTTTAWLADVGWRYGCLVSNLSLEAAEHSELLRERLSQILRRLTQRFAEAVRDCQAAGSVRADLDADDLATLLLAAWHGVLLRMKVDRSPEPLEKFRRTFFTLLCPASNASRNDPEQRLACAS